MAETFSTKDKSGVDAQAGESEIRVASDAKRGTEMASAKTMEVIKQKALVKEAARLTTKYGQANARVKAMNVRIGYSTSIQAVYQKEVDRSAIPAVAVPTGGWVVQGLVSSADGKVMAGVSVFMTEDGKTAVAGLPFSCTPATGAYAIALTSDQVDKLKGNANLSLAVSDANKNVLYSDSQQLGALITPDGLYGHNLVIGGGVCTAPPAGGAPVNGAAPAGGAPGEAGSAPSSGNNVH
jgi:hypothetical protein